MALFPLVLTMALSQLDHLVLTSATPAVVSELGGLDYLAWMATSYTLTVAVTTPVWGKLGDMYGRKGAFMTSIGIFLLGSVLGGMSQSMGQMVAFRTLQGLGAAGLMVGTFAIVGTLVPGRDRAKYQGLFSGVMAVAMVGGGPVGGLVTDTLGWRWAFYINVPIGVAALLLTAGCVRLPHNRLKARPDYKGAALLAVSVASVLLLSTLGGRQFDWLSPQVVGLALLSLGAGFYFVRVERRVEEPVLSLRLFRDINFTLGTLMGFLVGLVLFGAMTYLPLFQQVAQGASPTRAGLLLLPIIGAMTIVNVIVGQVISRTGKYRTFMIVGSVLIPVGLLLMTRIGPDTPQSVAGGYMAVFGSGLGLLMQATMLISLEAVEMKDLGVASSTALLARTVGGSVGAAVMGTLFTDRLETSLAEHAGEPGASGLPAAQQLDTAVVAKLPEAARNLYEQAVADGMQLVFLVGALITIGAAISAWFIREVPLRGTEAPQEDAPEPSPGGAPAPRP
ncbi:MDR family MFS transporter [Streptomyces sp. NPDC055189]